MKKKIMYITQSNGGVAKYLQMLFKYLNTREYEQILIYPLEYLDEKKDFERIIDNIDFIEIGREINIKNDIKASLQLYRIIKKYDPDLIYVNSSKAGAIGRIVNLFTKKPIIYNAHGWAFNMLVSNKKRFVYKTIERMLAKSSNKIVAISDKEKYSAIENKICSDDKIEVIYNGIDIEEYENNKIDRNLIRKELNIPLDSIVIGMVGRISKQKAPDIFIKVASEIKKLIPKSFFIIVGDGEEREELEVLINELHLKDSVLITGWVTNTYKYIQSFDIAMLLSRWEGFGLAIAEYMICEIPIIATNVDAIPNLIDNNINGVLISVDSIKEAVFACQKILNDKNFSENIVKNSKKKVLEEFNVKRVAEQHKKLFDSILLSK